MNTLTVTLDLPRDMLGVLDVPRVRLETRLQELIALELFRVGRISSGKGAELLGISKVEFVHLLAQHGLFYFTESPDELMAQVATLEESLAEGHP